MITCRFTLGDAETRILQSVDRAARGASYTAVVVWLATAGLLVGLGATALAYALVPRLAEVAPLWAVVGWPALVVTLALCLHLARGADTKIGAAPHIPEQCVTVDDDGIRIADAHQETRFSWSAFSGTAEHDGALTLRLATGATLILPPRGFATPADEQAARVLVAAHMAKV